MSSLFRRHALLLRRLALGGVTIVAAWAAVCLPMMRHAHDAVPAEAISEATEHLVALDLAADGGDGAQPMLPAYAIPPIVTIGEAAVAAAVPSSTDIPRAAFRAAAPTRAPPARA